MKRARILIADDHKMFAQGLLGLLEDDFDVLETVADASPERARRGETPQAGR
jgi:DNA-binding NarL/FixJ family response regulator